MQTKWIYQTYYLSYANIFVNCSTSLVRVCVEVVFCQCVRKNVRYVCINWLYCTSAPTTHRRRVFFAWRVEGGRLTCMNTGGFFTFFWPHGGHAAFMHRLHAPRRVQATYHTTHNLEKSKLNEKFYKICLKLTYMDALWSFSVFFSETNDLGMKYVVKLWAPQKSIAGIFQNGDQVGYQILWLFFWNWLLPPN